MSAIAIQDMNAMLNLPRNTQFPSVNWP